MRILFVNMLMGIAVLSLSCTKRSLKYVDNENIVCVKTELPAETHNLRPIQYPGILSSRQMIKLSFKTGGIINRIPVDEGSFVRKGQVIATLEMAEISAQASQAQLALEKAERDLNRVKNLYNDTVATLEQLQDATSAYEAALENCNIADFNIRYSKITAPTNGRIIAKLAEEYELIGPGMPVLVFTSEGKEEWVVKTGLSDRDVVNTRKGDKAKITFDAFPGKAFNGTVVQVAEMVDTQSGTFQVEITVDPDKSKMINGLVASVSIYSHGSQPVTLIPSEALVETDGKQGFVYIVDATDTTATKVPVTIAYLENDFIAVIEPPDKLGSIITEGASYLEEGTKISISNK